MQTVLTMILFKIIFKKDNIQNKIKINEIELPRSNKYLQLKQQNNI